MYSDEQHAWAKEQLKEILSGTQKTKYKELMALPDTLLKVEEALIYVAQEKYKSYQLARQGVWQDSFNWVNTKPDLAKEMLILQQQMVAISEIEMYPV